MSRRCWEPCERRSTRADLKGLAFLLLAKSVSIQLAASETISHSVVLSSSAKLTSSYVTENLTPHHSSPPKNLKPYPHCSLEQIFWDFHVGGYQVLAKYLKSRKGRALSLDEIGHVGAVADCLAFTIDQMAAIDVAYRAAFSERG